MLSTCAQMHGFYSGPLSVTGMGSNYLNTPTTTISAVADLITKTIKSSEGNEYVTQRQRSFSSQLRAQESTNILPFREWADYTFARLPFVVSPLADPTPCLELGQGNL